MSSSCLSSVWSGAKKIASSLMYPELYEAPIQAAGFLAAWSALDISAAILGDALKSATGQTLALLGTAALAYTSFGLIRHFYQKKVIDPFYQRKIDQIIVESQIHKKSALIIETTEDWNGAFSDEANFSLFDRVGKEYAIHAVTDEDLADVAESFDIVYVNAHGSKKSLLLSEANRISKRSYRFFGQLYSCLKTGAPLVLNSCRTALGKSNIAKTISEFLRKNPVIAPMCKVTHWNCNFDKPNRPAFSYGFCCFRRNGTKIYINGIPVKAKK